MRPSPLRPPWGLWVFLTVVVWGLFAADRGLYQDDVSVLAITQERVLRQGVGALVLPMGTPTRLLLSVPTLLGWIAPEPVLALQLLYGALWLAIAGATWLLVREALPLEPRAAWLAGTLTACATSDFLTDSLVALGYQSAVFLGVLAIALAAGFLRRGSWVRLAAACVLAAASVFTIDGATVALALAPALFLVIGGWSRRTLLAVAAWGTALLPYAVLLFRSVSAGGGYAATAIAPLTAAMRLRRTLVLLANDFFPWMWTFARPEFGTRPPHAIPPWFWGAAGIAAAAAVLFSVRRVGTSSGPRERARGFALWLAVVAVVAHAAWAGIAFQELFYRTHVLTRVAVSALLAIGLDRLLDGTRAARTVAVAALVLFTGFGAAGGMERQDLYLATWRRHRTELASLVDEVPRALPGTTLVLAVPHDPSYQATEAPYLAERWSELLWRDPAARPATFVWGTDAHTACVADAAGLRCRAPEEKDCFEAGSCPGTRFPWETLVLLTWRPAEGRFRLEETIPLDLLGGVLPPERYRPRRRIPPGPPDPHAARFLRGDVALARVLP